MYVTARSRDAEGTLGLVHSMPITGAGHSLLPISQPMEVQAQAVGVASSVGEGPNSNWGGTAYLMPVVTVPYANTMGQVNLHWPPSQDVYGKDLPLSADVNTLRYFFNLGTEYYGMSNNIQQQQQHHYHHQHHQHHQHHHHQQQHHHQHHHHQHHQHHQQQHYSYITSTPQRPHVLQNEPLEPTTLVPYDPETSTTVTEPLAHNTARKPSPTEKPSPSPHDFKKSQILSNSNSSCNNSQEKEVKDSMDSMASDLSDSGFTSSGEGEGEGEGEQGAEEDLDASVQPETRPPEEEVAAALVRGGEEVKVVKGKGKRKYYMYGNHKLIKPIKDIPPRFFQLLTDMKAAKERCQGQPIYMLASPAEERALEQDSGASLNAEAQCFYPRHQYSVCVVAGNPEVLSGNSSEASTSHLPPLPHPSLPSYAPQLPPSATRANSGSLGSVHGHPGPSLGSSFPPPPPLPPAHARAPSVDTDCTMSLVSGQVPVKSLPSSAETDYRSAKCVPSPSHQTENAAGLSLVRVGVSPSHAVSNMSSGVPNVPPPHVLPASACSSLSTTADNQPRVKYYVYPSSPLSTLQGAGGNPPNMPPGQVTYVMNPVTYGPPPTGVAYPPPVVGYPAYSRAVPCPTVAVQ